jgi:2,3-dihydroxybenzoate decarboxylase
MIIDCDSHIIPRDSVDYIGEDFRNVKPILFFDEKGYYLGSDFSGRPPDHSGATPLVLKEARDTGSKYDGMTDVEARLKYMENGGIDLQVLLPQFNNVNWTYLIDPPLAKAIARSHNLSILEIMRAYPNKFMAAALVALQDVKGSIEELQWAYDNGFQSVVLDYTYPVPEHPYGETLGEHRELWPFFEQVAELDLPIYLHATQHGHRILNLVRFQRIGLDFFAPHDAHMNLVSLITSGLLDELPTLKIIQAEIGTQFIKPLVQGLDQHYHNPPAVSYSEEGLPVPRKRKLSFGTRKLVPPEEAEEKNKLPPSHYFKNNFYFTIETEEPALADAVEFLGAGRFLFATDYPHDDPGGRMKFRDVEVMRVNQKLSETEKDLIRSENARALFKLS